MFKFIILAVFLFAAGCGSSGGASAIHTYEITVAAAANMEQEATVIKACDITIYETKDIAFTVGADDAAINRYIEIGHWRQIAGEHVNIKRCIDYVPAKGTP